MNFIDQLKLYWHLFFSSPQKEKEWDDITNGVKQEAPKQILPGSDEWLKRCVASGTETQRQDWLCENILCKCNPYSDADDFSCRCVWILNSKNYHRCRVCQSNLAHYDCNVNILSSRSCEYGTKSCEVKHNASNEPSYEKPDHNWFCGEDGEGCECNEGNDPELYLPCICARRLDGSNKCVGCEKYMSYRFEYALEDALTDATPKEVLDILKRVSKLLSGYCIDCGAASKDCEVKLASYKRCIDCSKDMPHSRCNVAPYASSGPKSRNSCRLGTMGCLKLHDKENGEVG